MLLPQLQNSVFCGGGGQPKVRKNELKTDKEKRVRKGERRRERAKDRQRGTKRKRKIDR